MSIGDICKALEEGRNVNTKDYDAVLQTEGIPRVIKYLEKRYQQIDNIYTIVEIFRLATEIQDFAKILEHSNLITTNQSCLKSEDARFCNTQIMLAEKYYGIEHSQQCYRILKKNEGQKDNGEDFFVHHNIETFKNPYFSTPMSDDEFNKKLNDSALDNWELYEFLKDERVRQKRYQG